MIRKKIRSSKSIYFSFFGFSLVFSLFYNWLTLICKLFINIWLTTVFNKLKIKKKMMFDKYSTWQRLLLARDLWSPLPNQHDTPEGDLYYVLFFSFLDSKEKSNIAITFTSMNFSSKLNPSDCKPTQAFSYCG